MHRTVSLIALATLIGLAACAPSRSPQDRESPTRSRLGSLYLYVQPLPTEAERLRAEVAAVAASPLEGGAPLALAVFAGRLDGGAPRRQRLLAFADLPPGSYRGLTLEIGSAELVTADGPAALALPDGPRMLATPFTVRRGEVTVLTLRLQMGPSIPGGFAFDPVFTAASPGELAPDATAVAVVPAEAALATFHKISGEVFRILRTAPEPLAAVYDPTRRRAYVAGAAEDSLEVFDIDRGAREQVFPLLLGDEPSALALGDSGRTLVAANAGSNTVTLLDAPVLAERTRLAVGRRPVAIIVAPDDRTAFVVNNGGDSISVVDLALASPRGQVAVEDSPVFAAFNARGDRLLVVHFGSPNLVVLDTVSLQVVQRAYVGPGGSAIAVDRRTDRIYLARSGTGRIEVFDPASLLPIDSYETGGDVAFLAIGPESDHLYAAVAGRVRVIRLVDGETSAVAELGADPRWIDVAGER